MKKRSFPPSSIQINDYVTAYETESYKWVEGIRINPLKCETLFFWFLFVHLAHCIFQTKNIKLLCTWSIHNLNLI